VRRLRDYQPVSINLAHAPVTGVVAAISGDIAYLEVDAQQLPEALVLPSTGEVAFLHEGRPVMLTGMVDRGGPQGVLAFQVRGPGQLRNKRANARLTIELTALVVLPSRPGESTREVPTIDVGAGGALLGDPALGAVGDPVDVSIELPGTRDVIVASGHIARVTPMGTGIAFDDIDPADQELLQQLVISVRFELARRFAGRA
jgi:PilZ domain-containing protein